MAKGYWVAHVTVKDPEKYKLYIAANAAPLQKYGGKFLVRGGAAEMRRGNLRPRHVVVEFESLAVARACYDSPEYQVAAKLRAEAADVDIAIVEGYESG